jgi:hypothetical protein
MSTENGKSTERRRRKRFELMCDLRYRVLDSRRHLPQQSGKTINMSSKGVLFESSIELPVGKRVELMIAWPAMLNEKCRLKMVAIGRIVRVENGIVATSILKHEFRTQGAALN